MWTVTWVYVLNNNKIRKRRLNQASFQTSVVTSLFHPIKLNYALVLLNSLAKGRHIVIIQNGRCKSFSLQHKEIQCTCCRSLTRTLRPPLCMDYIKKPVRPYMNPDVINTTCLSAEMVFITLHIFFFSQFLHRLHPPSLCLYLKCSLPSSCYCLHVHWPARKLSRVNGPRLKESETKRRRVYGSDYNKTASGSQTADLFICTPIRLGRWDDKNTQTNRLSSITHQLADYSPCVCVCAQAEWLTAQSDSGEPLGKPEQDMASGLVWLPSARRRSSDPSSHLR